MQMESVPKFVTTIPEVTNVPVMKVMSYYATARKGFIYFDIFEIFRRIFQNSNQQCGDINECADNDTNQCEMNCVNTEGSYVCSCNKGYEIAEDGFSCNDINECETGDHRCDQPGRGVRRFSLKVEFLSSYL